MIYKGGKCDSKEGDLTCEHIIPRVLGYKKRSDVKGVGITEFRVCVCVYIMDNMVVRPWPHASTPF
jgi:hypothetical protein